MRFNYKNAFAITENAIVVLGEKITPSECVAFGATLIDKLAKGYELHDQYGKKITVARVIKMVDHTFEITNNVLSDNGIIKLATIASKGNYTDSFGRQLKTNMGAYHAQLISIKNAFYDLISYCYEVEQYDETFRSVGVIDITVKEASYRRCKLSRPLTIITDNKELFYPYYDNGKIKQSIVDCYKHIFKFVYIEDMSKLENVHNILYKLGARINKCYNDKVYNKYTHDENRINILSNLFGYNVSGLETPEELNDIVKYFCDNFEESIDITKGYKFLKELSLPSGLRNKLDIYLERLVEQGVLVETENDTFYEDSYMEDND